MSAWVYAGVEFDPESVTREMIGFVYVIKNLISGRRYVGKKMFWQKRTLPPLKGKKRKRVKYVHSNWQKYTGSCDELNADIESLGLDNFSREIISIHANKTELNYAELQYQILHNVLDAKDEAGNRIWYNANVERIFYPSEIHGDQRTLNYCTYVKRITHI